MTAALTAFLAITLAMAVVALIAIWSRRPTHARPLAVLALAACAFAAFFASQAPLGHPDHDTPPAGRYVVLGVRIDVDVAIYAMLDGGPGCDGDCEPHFYRLPYTTASANDLQEALDNAGEGGGVEAEITDDGEAVFHEPPVTDAPEKEVETPLMNIGE